MTETPNLDRIIDGEPIPKPEHPPEWSEYDLKRFKRVMTKCKVEAKIIGRTLYTRPKEISKFGQFLQENGLATCVPAMEIAEMLKASPNFWVKWVH